MITNNRKSKKSHEVIKLNSVATNRLLKTDVKLDRSYVVARRLVPYFLETIPFFSFALIRNEKVLGD